MPVNSHALKKIQKSNKPRKRRPSPLLRRKKLDLATPEGVEKVVESVQKAKRIADLSEKIRLKLASIPGLFDDVADLIQEASDARLGGADLRRELNVPMDQESCLALGKELVEMFAEVGREEIRKQYAMEELAAVAREWEDDENDDRVDADFEEA